MVDTKTQIQYNFAPRLAICFCDCDYACILLIQLFVMWIDE